MKKIFIFIISLCLISPGFCYYGGYGPDPLSLTGNGTISGSWTVGGNIFVSQRAKIGLDGASGNSYIMSDTGDIMKFFTNGVKRFEIGTTSVTIPTNNLSMGTGYIVSAGGSIYLESSGLTVVNKIPLIFGDSSTKIIEKKAEILEFYTNGAKTFEIGTSSVTVNQPLTLNTYIDITDYPIYLSANQHIQFGANHFITDTAASLQFRQGTTVNLSVNKNTAVIKSTTTAGLARTTPVIVGEIYYNTGTKHLCISTGTAKGDFGAIAIDSYFK